MLNKWTSILAILFILSLVACDEAVEGCLDATATNFTVDADEDCCCTYPQLGIRLFHLADSIDMNFGTVYNDLNNQPFEIANMRFYLSNFHVVKTDGTEVGVTEFFTILPSPAEIENSYLLSNRNTSLYNIGTIADFGEFEKLRFNVGVNMASNHAEASQFVEGHPLSIQSDSMYWNATDGYIFNNIQIVTDTTTASRDTVSFQIGGDANLIPIELDLGGELRSGYDTELELDVNYLQFFEGVDFQNDSEETIKTKVLGNTENCFSIHVE